MSHHLPVPSATNGSTTNGTNHSAAVSVSPTTPSNLHSMLRQKSFSAPSAGVIRPSKVLHPFATGELRLLLLENISQGAVQNFKDQGFQVDWFPKAWSEDELIQKIGQYHAIGIRSKTKITEKVLKAATKSLEKLLADSDFVTLHVPESPDTKGMIGTKQFEQMRKGSYLINNARGKVVDIPALIEALKSGHLAGAALDVYPSEPGSNGPHFDDQLNSWATTLRSLPNIILTPHIGGSTEEAQEAIGQEVSQALTRYLDYGSTVGAVNFPEVDLRAIAADEENFVRVCYVHANQPGVLRQINEILASHNVEKQFSDSKGDIAYLMADIADVSKEDIESIRDRISKTRANIITRLLA
ncbi:hypothetical protein FRC17_010929 [Serendipita sp. 399]|nr:hypothetical protein FRC17_010929 [Serendipita sp. 399]